MDKCPFTESDFHSIIGLLERGGPERDGRPCGKLMSKQEWSLDNDMKVLFEIVEKIEKFAPDYKFDPDTGEKMKPEEFAYGELQVTITQGKTQLVLDRHQFELLRNVLKTTKYIVNQ